MISLPVLSICLISISGLLFVTPTDTSTMICYFSYVTRHLPRRLVIDYDYTSKDCSKPAVLFTTKKGLKLCANPQEQWVQNHVTRLT